MVQHHSGCVQFKHFEKLGAEVVCGMRFEGIVSLIGQQQAPCWALQNWTHFPLLSATEKHTEKIFAGDGVKAGQNFFGNFM